jgi:succinoglycan biosynthesis transport protein ExoP
MSDPNSNQIVQFSSQGQMAAMPGSTTSPRPAALSSVPDAIGLLKGLRRRWKLALVLGFFLAAVAGAATWSLVPPAKYTARATLHVSTSPKYIIFDPKERLADYRTYQKTQVALAKSQFVLVDALRKPEFAGLATIREHADAGDWLAEQLKVAFPDASEVLEISLTGDRPADLEKLVNAVVDSYLKLIVEEEQKERIARLEKLKLLWERYQLSLQAKRKELQALSETIGSNDKQTLSSAHLSKIQHLDVAEQERMRVKFELRRAEAELAVREASVGEAEVRSVPAAEIDERIDATPAILEFSSQIQRLTKHYNHVAQVARAKDDPVVVAARRQLDSTQRELASHRARLRIAIAEQIRNDSLKDDRNEIIKLRAQISVSKTYMETIHADIRRIQDETKTINRGGLDLSQQQDEIQIVSETARKIGAEVEAMEVELGAPSRIRVVDRAKVPNKKDQHRTLKVCGAATGSTFVFVLVGVSFWEFRARRIDSVDEVVHGLGLRLVGSLPALPNRPHRRIGEKERRLQSLLIESIDATRTMILHAALAEGIRMIMITSATKGEGKTSLAGHLATSLARTGRRTLLVDCDLRSPAAHRLLDLPSEPGLSEVLRNEISAQEAIHETPAGGLYLMPAGRSDLLAIQALATDRCRSLLHELKGRYDFIIVDSAPVLPVADSLLVGQIVDAVLFSILRDVSRFPLVHAAQERLSTLGVQTLGAVVSGTTVESYGSPYESASEA